MASNGRRVRDQVWYRSIFHPGEAIKESEVYRSAIRHPSPSTPRGRASDLVPELLPAPVPGEGATRGALVPIDAAPRVHLDGALRRAHHLRDVPDVLLPPEPARRVLRHALVGDDRRVRTVRAQHPPMVGPPDGARRVRAPAARLLRRRVQAASTVQLGDRRLPAAGHALPLVHRLPAPVGPALVLGDHRRDEHRRLRPADGRRGPQDAARRHRGRQRHAAPLLRPPRLSSCRR